MAKKKKSKAHKTEVVVQLEGQSEAKEVTVIEVTDANRSPNLGNLRSWNSALAVIFAVQAGLILIIGKSVDLPVVSHYLTADSLASQAAGHTVMALAVRHLFDLNLAFLVSLFLIVAAIFHALVATKGRTHYEADIKRGTNGLRWLEYAIAGSLMFVTIALLNGIYDIGSLLMIVSLVALFNLLGYFGESYAVTMKAKAQSLVGLLVAGGAVWLVIGLYLKSAIVYGSGLSHFVYWIDGVVFLLAVVLAFNILMVFRAKAKWADYGFGERIYMLLSLVAKSSLAWLILAGFLR